MGKKRTLAERAKKATWTFDEYEGLWRYDREGLTLLLGYNKHDGWAEMTCSDLGIESEEFLAGTLTAAKSVAIELVQERIRELCKAWEVPNV